MLVNSDNHTIRGDGRIEDLALTNHGTIRAETGSITADNTNLTGAAGSIVVSAGSEFEFNGLSSVLQQGSITLIDATSLFDFNGERFEVGVFDGSLDHDQGIFGAGVDSGFSTVTGDYTQISTNADFEVTIGGAAPGMFDSLTVEGDAALMGGLSVVLADGFALRGNEVFEIIDVRGALIGSFLGLTEGSLVTSYNGGADAGGVDLFITFAAGDGNDVALFTVPTPGAATLFGLAGLMASRRRR